MSKPDAEILVHITAPSSAVDDAGYRNLASAYLAFHPLSTTSLPPGRTVPGAALGSPVTGKRPDAVSVLASPQLSFAGPAHKLDSQELFVLHHQKSRPLAQESSTSWQPAASFVADSNPENNVSLPAFSSPTRIFEQLVHPPSSQSEGSQDLAPRTAPLQPISSLYSIEAGRERSVKAHPHKGAAISNSQGILSGPAVPIAETPGNTSTPQLPSAKLPPEGFFNLDSPAILSVREEVVPSSERADSEPPARKRRRNSAGPEPALTLARSFSDVGPRSRRISHPIEQPKRQDLGRNRNSLSIHSPDPPVSCHQVNPQSLVSPRFDKLARDLDISRRFRPKEQTRELRPYERGYWVSNWGGWDQSLRENAWSFLGNYVGTGLAGWGVWCRRDAAKSWIRLYCWGCIVGHSYLLLYLASQRQVLHTDCRWVDGEGNVCIVMGAREVRRRSD